jgi:ATP diphosphatase
MSHKKSLIALLEIMQILRDPEKGCPWDQQQSFASIAPYTIEEAYEVADAIAREDMHDLQDELGDLLFQVVYHAQMAAELSHFDFDDVVGSICTKLIRRHPHVFGQRNKTHQEVDVKAHWEQIKQQERLDKNTKEVDCSSLAGVSEGLPALLRARKLQQKAAIVHFDWTSVQPVLNKVREELDELEEAYKHSDQAHIEEELGDLLFSVVNASRHLQLDADIALQKANAKFEKRFRTLERHAKENKQELTDMSEQELEQLWHQVKQLDDK